jgi:hypothetical protein
MDLQAGKEIGAAIHEMTGRSGRLKSELEVTWWNGIWNVNIHHDEFKRAK